MLQAIKALLQELLQYLPRQNLNFEPNRQRLKLNRTTYPKYICNETQNCLRIIFFKTLQQVQNVLNISVLIGVTVVALKLLKMISAGLSDVNLALVLDIDAFLLLTVSSLWGVFVELVFFNGWQRSNI